jgi:hypothetical protein
MATVAESLFGVTPESLQRQRQQQLRQEAMDFASISDPFQQANFAIYQGAGNLARGVGGLLGAQDPELMRVRQRQELLLGVNIADPMALRQAATVGLQNGDNAAAQELARRALDIEKTQAGITRDVAAAAASTATAKRERQQTIPANIQTAQRVAQLQAAIPQFEAAGDMESANIAKNELAVLQKEKTGPQSELGKLLAEQAALDPVKNKAAYDAYAAKIKKLTTGKGLGGELAEGLGPFLGAIATGQSENLGKAGGTEVGKGVAAIEGKYTAKYALDDALSVLDKGIYAGGYGPMQEAVAKYTKGAIGSPERLANTEEFRSYIGNVVIPRLQEFGGNDSVEELKYLRSVMAGETTLEPRAIKNILGRASKNIERGIQRLERQSKEVQKGKPLSTGPVGGQEFTTRSGVKYTKE